MSERPDIIKIGGYADGAYTCLCTRCDCEFIGDERSINCLPCATLLADAELTSLRTALATARNDALEEAEQRCRTVAMNADYRAATHTDVGAVVAAMDKKEAALLCADAIRSLITKPTIEGEKP